MCDEAEFDLKLNEQDTDAELQAIINAARGTQDPPNEACQSNTATSSPRFNLNSWCYYQSATNTVDCTASLVMSTARRVCYCTAA